MFAEYDIPIHSVVENGAAQPRPGDGKKQIPAEVLEQQKQYEIQHEISEEALNSRIGRYTRRESASGL